MSSELQLDVHCLSCCGGDIWWTLTKERQACCYLQVKLWSMPERFECTTLTKKALYKYSSFPFLSCFLDFATDSAGRNVTAFTLATNCIFVVCQSVVCSKWLGRGQHGGEVWHLWLRCCSVKRAAGWMLTLPVVFVVHCGRVFTDRLRGSLLSLQVCHV